MVTRLLKSALNSLQIAWAKMCRRILWKHSPPRRGGVDAPSEATAQTGRREARARQGEASIKDRTGVTFRRTDHPGAVAPPLLAEEGNTFLPAKAQGLKQEEPKNRATSG